MILTLTSIVTLTFRPLITLLGTHGVSQMCLVSAKLTLLYVRFCKIQELLNYAQNVWGEKHIHNGTEYYISYRYRNARMVEVWKPQVPKMLLLYNKYSTALMLICYNNRLHLSGFPTELFMRVNTAIPISDFIMPGYLNNN